MGSTGADLGNDKDRGGMGGFGGPSEGSSLGGARDSSSSDGGSDLGSPRGVPLNTPYQEAVPVGTPVQEAVPVGTPVQANEAAAPVKAKTIGTAVKSNLAKFGDFLKDKLKDTFTGKNVATTVAGIAGTVLTGNTLGGLAAKKVAGAIADNMPAGSSLPAGASPVASGDPTSNGYGGTQQGQAGIQDRNTSDAMGKRTALGYNENKATGLLADRSMNANQAQIPAAQEPPVQDPVPTDPASDTTGLLSAGRSLQNTVRQQLLQKYGLTDYKAMG